MRRTPIPSLPDPIAADLHGEHIEGELARFFGYSHDLLAVMEGSGRVLVISPSVERVLGHPIGKFVGRRLIEWVHPEDQPAVLAQTRPLLEGTPIGDLDVRMSREDGAWVPMRWSLSVGSLRRIYAVGRDHTHQARHQAAKLRHEMAVLRLRTALELHDGILQTLTGATLQLAVARRLVKTDPGAAEKVLIGLGDSIAAEQQEMRLYVDELKGSSPEWADGTLGLAERIEALLDRVGMIWGLTFSVEVRVPDGLGGEFGRRILRIIQEATVNAARHGAAKAISVAVAVDGPNLTISIADDGSGFPFLGEYDYKALKEKRLGPLSLKHRVEESGGSISISSTPQGSRVSVKLPLPLEEKSK